VITRNAFKFGVILALVFAVVGGYGVFTAKAGAESANSVVDANVPRTLSPKETLKYERFLFGSSGVALAVGGLTLIDQASLTCPGPGTCTFTADEWLQVKASTTSNWAVASELDGNFMSGGGAFQGEIGTNYAVGSWSESSKHVAAGTHLIQTFGYMRDNPGTAGEYNFNYRVFQP
jgi:hypothetical protein